MQALLNVLTCVLVILFAFFNVCLMLDRQERKLDKKFQENDE